MIAAGAIDVGIACGVESMSRVPLGGNVPAGLGDPRPDDWDDRPAQPVRGRRPHRPQPRPTRAGPRRVRPASQQKARAAVDEGRFKREIAAVDAPVLDADGKPTGETRTVDTDQGLRDTTLEGLAGLRTRAPRRPAHRRHVVADLRRRRRRPAHGRGQGAGALGLTPRARIVTHCLVGSDPYYHLDGPIEATAAGARPHRHGIGDLDLFEVNEAFASVVLSWAGQHGVDLDKVNVNGGAIALGHPVGATGARLITTALHELERRDATTALISMCAGGAMATGTVIERL